MKDTSGLKREKCSKRHLIAGVTFPFDNFLPREICGSCCVTAASRMLNFDVSRDVTCRAYPLLSSVIGMHVRWQPTRARGGQMVRARGGRKLGGSCKSQARRSCTRRSPGVRRG